MQQPGDQSKIHLNPDFLSRGRAFLKPKVHVNPAFLQKSQETDAAQYYVPHATAVTTTTTKTDPGRHWQGLAAGTRSLTTSHMPAGLPHTYHRDTSTHGYSHSSKSVNGLPVPSSSNTRTSNVFTVPSSSNTKTRDFLTKSNSTVLSCSNIKSHSIYSKNNIYNPQSKSFSVHTKGLSQTQTVATKKVVAGNHSSSYSWKASAAKTWISSNQGGLSTSVNMHGNASFVKQPQYATKQHTYPNPAMIYTSVNKSFDTITATKRCGTSQKVTHRNGIKPVISCSSLHSLSYKNNNISHSGTSNTKITGNLNLVKESPTKAVAKESCDKVTLTMSQAMQATGQTSSATAALNKFPGLHINKIKSEQATNAVLPQNIRGTLVHQSLVNKSQSGSVTKAFSPGRASKTTRLTSNQKWVSKNKLVNSSFRKPAQTKVMNVSISNNQGALKTPRQKGNYKIITKTKLVRTNSTTKGKVQQQASVAGQSVTHGSKTAQFILPRATSTAKISKSSPTLRTHTNTRINNKRRYSVLSQTKLVRSQNLSGKGTTGTTTGKPKYSVNTKNKLVRRRSNSGSGGSKPSSKASDSKTKASKPETERLKKFHVLSKTKIVRRRSSSGVYKASSSAGLVASTPAHHRKRAIVKRHKLIRNLSSSAAKRDTHKSSRRSFTKKVNTAFKVINTSTKISPKQRLAKGIISKYKINRLKVDSLNHYRKHHKYFDNSSKARQKNKYKFQNKKRCSSKQSDRFINIGGILYKSTKTSLRKQLPKANHKANAKKTDISCTVVLRGEKFRLTAGGKTLQRITHSPAAKSSMARVHLGGLTFSRTQTGHYELTKTHQARALLSSARQRSMVTLTQKKRKALYQKRNEYCVFFNRFGRCTKKDRGQCPYVHDPSRVAICTRFLRGRCPVSNCPFSHTIDPAKMPVCSHFLQTACTREDCPYRHVKVNPSAPVCLDFVRGHCKAGEECDKQHVLVCEEFQTGKCPRGASCPLSHHKGKERKRKVSFSGNSARQTSLSMYRKRRRSESLEILGGPVVKKRVEKKKRNVGAKSSQQRYFHLVTTDDSQSKDADGEQMVLARTVNPDSENEGVGETAGKGFEMQEVKVKDTGSDLSNSSAGKSLLEEKRSRMMKKVDQLKKSHLGLNADGVIEDTVASYMTGYKGTSELKDSHQPSTESSKSNDQVLVNSSEASTQPCSEAEDLSSSDQQTVQRPPLPKRLPSYIPLTMDED